MSEIVQVVGVSPSGGISQQPAAQRLPGQVEDATNVVFDAGYGFYKRPGTDFDRAFTATAGADVRHDIWTYGDEKYIVVWGKINAGAMTVRVFRIGGNECAVTFDSGTATYLAASSATGSDILLRPVGDNMLLVNTKVATALTTTSAFTIERTRPTYRDLIAYTSTTSNYLRTENDDATADAGYYQYEPGTYKYAHINFPTITNPWSIHNGYWDDTGYGNNAGFKIAFRRQGLTGFTAATWTAATRTLTKTGAFTSYTFRSGDMIYITAGTGHTVGWYQIASRTSADAIVLSVDAGLSGADNADTEANATDATSGIGETNICRIGRQVNVEIDFANQSNAAESMHDIANLITQALRNAGCENACCAWVPQSQGGNFQITGPYRGDDARVYLPTAPAAGTIAANGDLTSSGRPFYSTNAQIYAGSGGTPTVDTSTPESRYTRTAAPSQSNGKLDSTTMPVKLYRTAANTFQISVPSWTPRTSGTSGNNPGPKLFTTGQKIADAVWHKNRLFLCGGPYIAGSTIGTGDTAGGLDFFISDPTQIVDSDPIDKTLPGEDQGGSKYLAGFRDGMVVFCNRGQFELGSNDQPLSPSTASITPSTRYPVSSVRPKVGTTQLYFLSDRDDSYSAMLEYYHDDLKVASEAADVTVQVPRLVPVNCRSIAVSVPARSVLVLPDDSYQIIMYRWLFDNGQKVQSSWTTFDFDGNYRILDIAGDGGTAWMLVENTGTVTYTASASPTTITFTSHGLSTSDSVTFDNATDSALNGTWTVTVLDADTFTVPVTTTTSGTARWCSGQYVIEKMALTRPVSETGWPYPVHMDRKLELTGVHSLGTTTFTLPATPTVLTGSSQFAGKGSTLNKIVLGPDFGSSAGTVVSIAGYTSTTVTVTGDYSAGECVLGRYYESEVVMSRPYVRDGRGRSDITGKVLVMGVSSMHEDTMAYTIEAVRSGSSVTTRTRDYSSTAPADGQLRTLLDGDPEKTTWTITDTSASTAPLPVNITQVSFDVEYAPGYGKGVLGGAN